MEIIFELLFWTGVFFAVWGTGLLLIRGWRLLADALATLDVENRRTRR